MTFLFQIHAIVLSVFWFALSFFRIKGMEWISRYKAVFYLFSFLAVLVVVYVYNAENDDVTPTSHTWRGQDASGRLYDVIVQRSNKTVLISSSHDDYGYEGRNVKVISSDDLRSRSTTKDTDVSEFGWIKHMNSTNVEKRKFATKTSEISEENMMLLPSSKAKFHRRITQLNIERDTIGEAFLEDLPDLPKPVKGKYLVYLCDDKTTCGGLGDRQRGIMGVFFLALVTRRRFGIRMASPCDFGKFFQPNKIDWTVGDSLLKLPFVDYINAKDKPQFKRELTEEDFNDRHLEDVIFIRNNQDFSSALVRNPKYSKLMPPWSKSDSRAEMFSKMWSLLFQPAGKLKVKLNEIKTTLQTSSKRLVCAHVRIGRNPTIPVDQGQVNSVRSVKILWKFLRQYGDDVFYFIATDAETVRSLAREEFGSSLLTVDGKIRHIDRQRDDSSVCEGFETALLEQQILTQCDVLVVSQSGFSIFAAYMRNSAKNLFKFSDGNITPFELP